jgi:hypothetical protein
MEVAHTTARYPAHGIVAGDTAFDAEGYNGTLLMKVHKGNASAAWNCYEMKSQSRGTGSITKNGGGAV